MQEVSACMNRGYAHGCSTEGQSEFSGLGQSMNGPHLEPDRRDRRWMGVGNGRSVSQIILKVPSVLGGFLLHGFDPIECGSHPNVWLPPHVHTSTNKRILDAPLTYSQRP